MTESPYVVRRQPDQARFWSAQNLRPWRLDMELTERCNNDCIHCCINRPVDDASALAGEMSTDQVKTVLRQAADLGCLQVRFTGGEPLLRPDWDELYLYTRRLGMKVLLFTNARLITHQLVELLAKMPPLEPIEITVYGMRRESYEAVTRVRGSFAQFRRGVDLLLEHKVPFVVKSVLLPQNRHETDEFETWAKTIPWMKRPPSYTVFLELRSRRDDAKKNALIESLRPSPQEALEILTRNTVKYRCDMTDFASKFMGPSGTMLFGCGAGHGMCIDAYGTAQPCMGIRSPDLTVDLIHTPHPARKGDSACTPSHQESRTGQVMLADAMIQFSRTRDLHASNPDYLRRCARCFLKGLCEQCPAKSWVENGTLDKPVEYLCEMAHAQARYLGWLGDSEHGWEVTDWQDRVNSHR